MGVLRLRGDLVPATNNTGSIGSETARWKDVFVGPGTINILDNVTSASSNITVSNGVFHINNIAQAQLPNVTVTNLTFHDGSVQTSANNYCGSFEDNSDQPTASVNVPNTVLFRNSSITDKGITIDSTFSNITVSHTGNYFFTFLGQYEFPNQSSVKIWYNIDGTPYANSARTFGAKSSNDVVSLQDIIHLNSGQKVQFKWVSADNVQMKATPSAGAIPGGSSASVNVYKV